MTAGAWSPTRPATLIVAHADGLISVWDFVDSSHRPSIELKVAHNKICSIEFMLSATMLRHQLLAVGVDTGTLQIFELPRNLVRPIADEEELMENFISRELETIKYLEDFDVTKPEGEEEQADLGSGIGGGDAEEKIEESAEELKKKAEEKFAEEVEEYSKLEAEFIMELGLSEDELPQFAKGMARSMEDKE
jgi:hypothetical protein